ncbi:MAG: ABC transporter substrate-binding protein [Saccharolobus sp.]|uniref:ABC transporter substrate-binding protein n=1 Tax=Saccharolobus sp. TaxID=2100761 RepID=UPI003178B6D5
MVRISRREWVKYIGTGVGGAIIGGAIGYLLKPAELVERIETTKVVEKTVSLTVPTTLTTTVERTITSPVVRKLPKDTIKIGVMGILSGLHATWGDLLKKGALLAAKEINATGGILGSKVEVIIRDEVADVEKQVRELVDVEKVDFIVGFDSSSNAMKVGGIVDELGKIIIVTHAATHRFTEELVYKMGKKLLFRISVPIYQDAIFAAYVAKDLPVNRWVGINPDYEFGRVCWSFFTKTLKQLRPDVEFVSEQWPKLGTEDFTPFISAIMGTDGEALYTSEWGVEFAVFYKQFIELGGLKKFKAIVKASGYPTDMEYEFLWPNYPLPELGFYPNGRYYWGYPPSELNRSFVEKVRAEYGKRPGYGIETTYSAFYFIKTALETAVTLDPDVLVKTLEGMVLFTPAGARWIRPEDHQAIYEVPSGRIVHKPGFEAPVYEELKVLPAWIYYRHPPFE